LVLELTVVEDLRDRLLLRFGVGEETPLLSSGPLVRSMSVSFVILVPSRLSIFCRAAIRSPPDTVLFRPRLGGGVDEGEGSYVSVPPVNFIIAILRPAAAELPALFERIKPF
jgi:hypothetical protein